MRTVLVVLATLVPTWAHAEPSTTTIAEADALFDDARKLQATGKLGEACSAFEASEKLVPALSTLINLADCRQQNKQFATAYGLFREVERQTRTPLDDKTQQLNRFAAEQIHALEGRLSRLTISVPTANQLDGLQIRRGSELIEPGAWNRSLPVDGGTYTITARAPGHIEATLKITISSERDTKTLDIPLLAASPHTTGQPVHHKKLVPLLLAGAGAALLGTALASDLSARSEYDRAVREQDDVRQNAEFDRAKTKRFAAQGLAVGGIGAAGAALWVYLRSGRTQPEPSSLARIGNFSVEPIATVGHTGLQLTRRY